jgi:hypothetical protein
VFVRTVLVAALALAPQPAPAPASPAHVTYVPPVEAPIADAFRRPVHAYAAGNRGVDYATQPGTPVRAAAAGTVTFAGRVGFGRHVVITHADGVRTTYAFLASISSRATRGRAVRQSEVVGTAGGRLHFGARVGDTYIDPQALFANTITTAHLVDDDAEHSALPALDERRALLDLLHDARPAPSATEEQQWRRDNDGCTDPADAARPAPVTSTRTPSPTRRLAVLVGGLGSATGHAAVLDVDTTALGYAPEDVTQFSYRADGQPYAPEDTQQDINHSARLLADNIARLHATHPDVPIDVIAHSQGGLVARAAATQPHSQPHATDNLAGVATIVTVATPHQGNALATAAQQLNATSPAAQRAFDIARRLGVGGIDPTSTSVQQLATDSTVIASTDTPLPSHIDATSIAASTDAVVPTPYARWSHGRNVTVDLDGPPTPKDHARAPGDAATTREIALAIAGRAPTCVPLAEWHRRQEAGTTADQAQRAVIAALTHAAGRLDGRLPTGGREVTRL